MPENDPSAVVLKAPMGRLEISGSEGFVLRMAQTYHLPIMSLLSSAAGTKPVEPSDADPNAEDGPMGMIEVKDVELPEPKEAETPTSRLRNWYAGLQRPTGKRGFVQDHVMLFIYYLTRVLDNDRAKAVEITQCFKLCGIDVPKVSQAIAAIRKTTKYVRPVPPGKRDHQLLTSPGIRYVELRFRILTVKT